MRYGMGCGNVYFFLVVIFKKQTRNFQEKGEDINKCVAYEKLKRLLKLFANKLGTFTKL